MRDLHTIRAESKRCVLFSVFRPENGDRRNLAYHKEAEEILNRFRIEYAEVVGCYEGDKERTFLVILDESREIAPVLNLAARYKQDSVLVLDPASHDGKRRARLIADLDASRPVVAEGPFYATTREDALSRIAWTFQPRTGVYYVADLAFE